MKLNPEWENAYAEELNWIGELVIVERWRKWPERDHGIIPTGRRFSCLPSTHHHTTHEGFEFPKYIPT